MNNVRIQVDHCGSGKIFIDDIELGKYAYGFNVKVRAGEITEVSVIIPAIHLTAEMPADVKAVIERLTPSLHEAIETEEERLS